MTVTPLMPRQITPLSLDWTFRVWEPGWTLAKHLTDPEGWQPATVPGTVQQELLALGELPDPFYGLNELEVQWVSERSWLYRAHFDHSQDGGRTDLCLEGLDTLCTVYLNGEVVLESENMFVPQRVDLRERARKGRNELALLFHPVLERAHQLRDERGPLIAWNGDPSRVYIRKAQYHFGWDWGPTLLSVGPWRPVSLDHYRVRIASIHAPVEISSEGQVAFDLRVELEGEPLDVTLHITLRDPDGHPVLEDGGAPADTNRRYEVPQPRLWWPHGHGEQALYHLEVEVRRGVEVLDQQTQRIGLRKVELSQQPVEGEPGSSFTFVVNGRELFMGGVNWIPEDLLLPRIPPERYRERVRQMVEGNHLMVRVWGGGIYEDDLFYDLCDEAGLLVWQDFMFACGLYPAYPAFLDSVRDEAAAAVRRLRHHPCLALWCGGNENYAVAQAVGAAGPKGKAGAFVGPAIHAGVLPDVVSALDPHTPYWTDSPFGGELTQDPTVGDRHVWDVYHGMLPIEDYRLCKGRFISEFGMQSMPSLAAVETVTPLEQRRPYSRVMEHHQKAKGGTRRLASYLSDHFDPACQLEQFIFDTHLLQAEAMKYAYQAYRGRWGKHGARAVSGALAWQINDLWPVCSWAVIDSLGVPKPAYYAIARELRPVAAVLDRRPGELSAWLVSDRAQSVSVELDWEIFDLAGQQLAAHRWTAQAAANAVTPLELPVTEVSAEVVLFMRAFQDGAEVSRSADWPRPFRYYDLPHEPPQCRFDGQNLIIETTVPLRNVWIASSDARASDNALDLRPGERVQVSFDRPISSPLRVQALGVPAFTVAKE